MDKHDEKLKYSKEYYLKKKSRKNQEILNIVK
jgi:hypothetical protein